MNIGFRTLYRWATGEAYELHVLTARSHVETRDLIVEVAASSNTTNSYHLDTAQNIAGKMLSVVQPITFDCSDGLGYAIVPNAD